MNREKLNTVGCMLRNDLHENSRVAERDLFAFFG